MNSHGQNTVKMGCCITHNNTQPSYAENRTNTTIEKITIENSTKITIETRVNYLEGIGQVDIALCLVDMKRSRDNLPVNARIK